jgi:glycosyltransferase 2 family protein
VDRVFDGIVVLGLAFLALPRQGLSPAVETSATLFGMALVLVVLGLYMLVFFPATVIGIFHWSVGRMLPRLATRGEELLRSFANGLGVLRHPAAFVETIFWTVLHWLVNALSLWLAFEAIGLEAPWMAALFVQGVIVFGVAVPSTPGFAGVFELMAVTALLLYGVDGTMAGAWAVAYHAVSYVPITLIGLWYLGRMGMGLGEIAAASKAASTTDRTAA